MRLLTLINEYSRECLAIDVARQMASENVRNLKYTTEFQRRIGYLFAISQMSIILSVAPHDKLRVLHRLEKELRTTK